jgi:hypothetical protein
MVGNDPAVTCTPKPKARPPYAPCSAHSPGSSPTSLRRSCATTRMASANWSWRAGACRDHCSLAANRSPTSATSRVRIGAAGFRRGTAVSCRRHRSANTLTRSRATPTWFALSEDRPLFAFAGLWRRWRGVRGPKSAPVEGDHNRGVRPLAGGRDRRGAETAAAVTGRDAGHCGERREGRTRCWYEPTI